MEGTEPGRADAVLLEPLSEDSFLHNLHLRYNHDVIYTYVGSSLVAVNPCRALPLYSAELVRAYLTRPPHHLPPHIYAVAAGAWRRAVGAGRAALVVTGESGAGKTEAARVALQLAALAAPAPARAPPLTAAGTLLEGFGHAATARNHNASRFGKLLDIEFDFKGEPIGGHITHFLLEKERASGAGVAAGERNFHVLYQLLAGADGALLKRLRLQRAWEQYRVLRGGSPRRAPPDPRAASADKDHFAFTKAAMVALGFSAGERGGVLRLLAFLLKLGNVRFEPAHLIDGSLGARLLHEHELEEACSLVGVSAEELATALGAAPPRAAPPEPDDSEAEWCGTDTDADGDDEWCAPRRDRLLSALYSRLFTWLVTAVNARLRPPAGGGRTLSIVDVYGLESLAHNSLERLLINAAAERVQACVTRATLRAPQDEYVREGLTWAPLRVPDHDLAADLLDAGPESVLGLLRECSARDVGDAAFLQRLQRRPHPRLLVLPPHHFQVVHFGGAVAYDARGMVGKNRDAVCRRVSAVLARAAEPLLAALFAPAPAHAGSPRRAGAASLACRQRALLGALARRLADTPPCLVRCLRADAQLRPHRFDTHLVRHQLRTQGLVELAQLRRAGWCESLDAHELLAHHGAVRASPARGAVRDARALLRALPLPGAEFAFGRSRVFVRSPRTLWELEALRAARVTRLVTALQRAWRRRRARLLLRRRDNAQRIIARAWRRYKARGSETTRAVRAASVVWRAWCTSARRRYLVGLWARLPARHLSPACGAWPPCPAPRLLARVDAHLRRLHHRWRCRLYRNAFDQTARNRMREKVTASVLFRGRKALYARSVPHPFVGDYVRLRASAAWRRGPGGAGDRYVVFADVARKLPAARRVLAVVSTHALLLLEPRSLRLRRRVPANAVYRLSLSPHADDLLCVHVACGAETEEWAGREGPETAGCLVGERRRGDVLLRTCHVLELATKLFLVVQNAVGAPPHVNIASQWDATVGGQPLTVTVHANAAPHNAPLTAPHDARFLRRGSHLDVLL